MLQSAALNLSYTEIRAPITGRVGKIEITAGNLIAAGPSSPILTRLVSLSPIYASFEADEQIVSGILAELPEGVNARNFLDRVPVQMDVAGHPDIKGKLQLVDNSVDPESGTIRVRAVFDNANGALMPGQFARLSMGQSKTEDAVLVNERAIGTDQNKKYVMVVKPDNTTEYREITVGMKSDGLRVVTSGLKAKERIVVNGLQRIRPGSLVAPEMVSMSAGTNAALQASIATISRPPALTNKGDRAMNISRFFIDRPVFAGVLSFLIFLGGLIAMTILPISEYPDVVPPPSSCAPTIRAPTRRSSPKR